MGKIYEREVQIPFYSSHLEKTFNSFDEYFNDVFSEDSELISVQFEELEYSTGNERLYTFFIK